MKRLKHWIKGLKTQHGFAAMVVAFLFLLVAVCCVLYLTGAETPWGKTVSKRIASGKDLSYREFGIIGLWWASWINLGLSILGLGTFFWWGRKTGRSVSKAKIYSRWVLVAALGSLVLGTVFRAPRLSHSLWNDEEYALRKYTWGEWREGKDGELTFQAVPWEATFFSNKSNNHLGFTIPTRICMELDRRFTGLQENVFRESTFRLCPFLGALGSIFLLIPLGREMGSLRVGVVSSYLLAINPWHIMHSTNARGYALMVFWLLLALLFLFKAFRSDRWRWWLGFGFCQSMMALSFSISLWVALVMNGCIGCWILTKKGQCIGISGKWFVANLIGAMFFLQLMAPSIPQMVEYAQRAEWKGTNGWFWLREWWSFANAGMPWVAPDPDQHLGGSASLEVPFFLKWIAPTFVFVGLVKMVLMNRETRVVVLVLFLSGGFHLLVSNAHEIYQHIWYIFWPSAGLVIASAWAIEAVPKWADRYKTVMQVMVILLFFWIPNPNRLRLMETPLQPLRETVRAIRANDPDAITATLGPGAKQTKSYDPKVTVLKDAEMLDQLIHRASERHQHLYIYFAGNHETAKRCPKLYKTITDQSRFRWVDSQKGLEAFWSYQIYQLPE